MKILQSTALLIPLACSAQAEHDPPPAPTCENRTAACRAEFGELARSFYGFDARGVSHWCEGALGENRFTTTGIACAVPMPSGCDGGAHPIAVNVCKGAGHVGVPAFICGESPGAACEEVDLVERGVRVFCCGGWEQ